VNEDGVTLRAEGLGRRVRVVVGVADQAHLDQLSAEVLDPVDLLGRRYLGHEDRRPDTERLAGERDALRVVAGAGADNPALTLLRRHRVDPVVGAADLEGADLLEILPLDQDVGGVALGEPVGTLQRRPEDDRGKTNRGILYRLLEIDGDHLREDHSKGVQRAGWTNGRPSRPPTRQRLSGRRSDGRCGRRPCAGESLFPAGGPHEGL